MEEMVFERNVSYKIFSIWWRPIDFTIKKFRIPESQIQIPFLIRNQSYKGHYAKKLVLEWINGAFQCLLDFYGFPYIYKSINIFSCVKGTKNLYTVSESWCIGAF